MKFPRGVRRWFRLRTGATDVLHDIDDELQFHIESRIEDLVRRGSTEAAARAQALREFGDVCEAREKLCGYARRHRERIQRNEWWSDVGTDFRLAFRFLKQRPGFVLLLALTLGLGLGANLVTFDVADRLLFRPPAHVVDADGIRRIHFQRTYSFLGLNTSSYTTYVDFLDLQRHSRSLSNVAAFASSNAALGRGDDARRVRQGIVTASFFDVLGVRPHLGSFYSEAEDSPPHGTAVVVLDYDFWQGNFGGARDVLGTQLLIGNTSYAVIGVAPRGFTGVGLQRVDVWTPASVVAEERMGSDFATSRNMTWLQLIARLKPDVTTEQAEQEATAVWRRVAEPRVQDDHTARVLLSPIQEARGPGETRLARQGKVATWLGGVSLLVLLVACANAANLMLARTIDNRREIGIRIALGIGRMRLFRQLVVEGLVLVTIAAAGALLIAHYGATLLHAVLLRDIHAGDGVLNARMLGFLAIAVLFTLAATLLPPGIQMLREAVIPSLRSGAREGRQRSRLRVALLFTQAVFSVVLLIGATLFVRSLQNAARFDFGFDPHRTLVADVDLHLLDMKTAQIREFYEQAMERVARTPGVESTAISSAVPMESSRATTFRAEGVDSVPIPPTGGPYITLVTPSYFQTTDIRVLEGRAFSNQDRKGTAPVAVLGQTMARLLWPGESALGKCVYIGGDDDNPAACSTVVGVVEDVRTHGIVRTDVMQYYVPLAQEQVRNSTFALFVRAKSRTADAGAWSLRLGRDADAASLRSSQDIDAAALVRPVTRELQAIRSGLPYVNVRVLQSLVDPQLESWRLGAVLFTTFGILGLLLAAIGLYSMLSWAVASRTREMGVRIALGARARDVITLIMKDGMRVAAAGVIVGIILAAAASKFVAPLLFDVSPREPLPYLIGGAILLAVALLATILPARRATTVEPAITLKSD